MPKIDVRSVYDTITHEVLCVDLTCIAPGLGELGDAIGAHNAVANIDVGTVAACGVPALFLSPSWRLRAKGSTGDAKSVQDDRYIRSSTRP